LVRIIDDDITEGHVTLGKTGIYLTARTKGGKAISFSYVQMPELKTVGVSNITHDQRFVLFLDFDRITEAELHRQLELIHEKHGVSHFITLTTGPNRYHVACFEKFDLPELQEIVNETVCDYAFKEVPLKSDKGWILRFRPKYDMDGKIIKDGPIYLGADMFEERPKRKLSRAHLEFFMKMYPQMRKVADANSSFGDSCYMKCFDEKYWDSNTAVNVIRYGTSKSNLFEEMGVQDLANSRKIELIWSEEK
jgi:hypothetical protein